MNRKETILLLIATIVNLVLAILYNVYDTPALKIGLTISYILAVTLFARAAFVYMRQKYWVLFLVSLLFVGVDLVLIIWNLAELTIY